MPSAPLLVALGGELVPPPVQDLHAGAGRVGHSGQVDGQWGNAAAARGARISCTGPLHRCVRLGAAWQRDPRPARSTYSLYVHYGTLTAPANMRSVLRPHHASDGGLTINRLRFVAVLPAGASATPRRMPQTVVGSADRFGDLPAPHPLSRETGLGFVGTAGHAEPSASPGGSWRTAVTDGPS